MMYDVLHDNKISRLIEEALFEDVGLGDITTESIVPSDARGKATLISKASGVIAGLEVMNAVFRAVDPGVTVEPHLSEGTGIAPGTTVATVEGPLGAILKAERTALNFLQRMSGIATLTRSFVDAVAHTHAKITDTRKTAPSLRIIDKLAVASGGGVNHRFGLDEMVLIKDNHIAIAGGVGLAIDKCQAYLRAANLDPKIEVEASNFAEVAEVLKHDGVHRIMLDNFTVEQMRRAVDTINRRVEVEASGNVSLENVATIAETGVDYISIGALTHSAKALDVSLEVQPSGH